MTVRLSLSLSLSLLRHLSLLVFAFAHCLCAVVLHGEGFAFALLGLISFLSTCFFGENVPLPSSLSPFKLAQLKVPWSQFSLPLQRRRANLIIPVLSPLRSQNSWIFSFLSLFLFMFAIF